MAQSHLRIPTFFTFSLMSSSRFKYCKIKVLFFFFFIYYLDLDVQFNSYQDQTIIIIPKTPSSRQQRQGSEHYKQTTYTTTAGNKLSTEVRWINLRPDIHLISSSGLKHSVSAADNDSLKCVKITTIRGLEQTASSHEMLCSVDKQQMTIMDISFRLTKSAAERSVECKNRSSAVQM